MCFFFMCAEIGIKSQTQPEEEKTPQTVRGHKAMLDAFVWTGRCCRELCFRQFICADLNRIVVVESPGSSTDLWRAAEPLWDQAASSWKWASLLAQFLQRRERFINQTVSPGAFYLCWETSATAVTRSSWGLQVQLHPGRLFLWHVNQIPVCHLETVSRNENVHLKKTKSV